MNFNFKKYIFNITLNAYSLSVIYFLTLYYTNTLPDEEVVISGSFLLNTFGLFFALGAVAEILLALFKVKTLGEQLFARPGVPIIESNAFWKTQIYSILFLTLVASVLMTKVSIIDLIDESGFLGAMRLFKGIFSPNFDILPKAILAIIETIFIAFLATFIAVPFAFFLSFVGAKNIMKGPVAFTVYMSLRTFLNIVRSVEPLIWAIIFSVWVGIGPFAGMLTLMLHSVASLTKQYSEIVECIFDGPVEGIKATGASRLQTIRFGVVPQIVLPYISFTIYRWDINVRMATIIGLVGGGGIGTMLIQYQGQALWREVGCIVVVIAVVVWLLDTGSAYIREAIK